MKKIRIFAGDYGRTKQCEGARKTGATHRGAGETDLTVPARPPRSI